MLPPRAVLTAIVLLGALLPAAARAADPTVTLFSGGAVEANSITADPDGNAYVLAAEGAPIGKVSPTGAKSSIDFTGSIGPSIRLRGLTYGPDDALWFSYNTQLTRVTQAGERTDFPIAMGARPATGADGNLWFPETGTGMIARVTPAGAISRFAGASDGTIGPLALGPDGNLWYANASAGVLGRVSEAGTITELPLPAGWTLADRSPVASDGDGGLWVLLAAGGFGHLDLAGHALGAPAGLTHTPSAIALGADGNLWFVELGTASIGWITPSGEIHELVTPFGVFDRPSAIAAAGDGSLWVTDFTNPKVWRISPAEQSAATGASSALSTDGATVAGLIVPRGTRTTVTFEYGTTSAYGSATAPQDAGAGDDLVHVTAPLTGLEPATTYHYRVVARSGVGTVQGQDETFTTLPTPALVTPKAGSATPTPAATTEIPAAAVVAESKPPVKATAKAAALPRLALTRDARWVRHGKAVVFTRLTLGALPAGARLTLTCTGTGCGFARYATTLPKATKSTNLLAQLHGSQLRRGAVVELRVTQAGHIGRVVRWTIGAPTRTKTLCLTPGAAAPTAC